MKVKLLLVPCFILVLVCAFQCTEERKDDCEGNAPPEIIGLHLVVDGNEIFEGFDVRPDDQVSFFLDYSDEDCNLNGGQIFVDWMDSGLEFFSRISIENQCEGIYPGQLFSFLKTIQDSGQYDYTIQITDDCGSSSNKISGSLLVGHAPQIQNAYFNPPSIQAGEKTSLEIRVCDEDNDLNGGEVLLYKHGNPAPIFEPIPWSHLGASQETDVSNCDAPRTFSITLNPLQSVCLDVHGTDAMQHGSGRYTGGDGQGVCIQVDNS